MMNHVDHEHIHRVSHLLDLFEERSDGKFVFRCPYCGDSRSNKNKKTAAIVSDSNGSVFKCLRCETTKGVSQFLKDVDPITHRNWVVSRWKRGGEKTVRMKEDSFPVVQTIDEFLATTKNEVGPTSCFSDLEPMTKLRADHSAVRYMNSRKVPFCGLYWTDDFWHWASQRGKRDSFNKIEGRIVFPLIIDKHEVGGQGRLITAGKLRYATVSWDNSRPMCYGLDDVDMTRDFYVVEGVFDALSSGNGVAVLRSDLTGLAEKMNMPKNNAILVCDNEPGNPNIAAQLKKAIDQGWRVGIWRGDQRTVGKDISDCTVRGLDFKNHIDVLSGFAAKMRYSRWCGAVT